MCRAQCILVVVALYVGVAHSWDFAVSLGDQLIFHTYDGTETDRVHLKFRNLGGLAYDVVHNRMLYVDKHNNNDAICGYNLYSKGNECFIERSGRNILSIAYDPATKKLFFTDTKSINWFSLKRGYSNNKYGNLLIKMDDRTPDDIAVDSCGGYIYWTITEHTETMDIERARFDGSEREFLYYTYSSYDVNSLTIDPPTQKIYYLDYSGDTASLTSADMDGSNTHVKFLKHSSEAKELTVSKDYLYFVNTTRGLNYKSVWRYAKNGSSDVELKELSKFYTDGFLGLAANYKIEDQIKKRQDCDSLSNLILTISEAPANTGDRYDVCVNYCLHGNCSVNDEGLPKCSCNAGYLGERCEVSACCGYCQNDGECSLNENSVPICQCKGDYSGDRCQIADCLNYCFKGNCSLSDEGHPTCSCNAGYSGARCEVSVCNGYCQNDGECSLNENSVPVCHCKRDYSGDRCQIADCLNYCFKGNCSLSDEGHPTCSCNAGYSGARCEVSVCNGYCQNDGGCSLNENSVPVCHCIGDYSGDRCHVNDCLNYCFQGNCSLSDERHPTCSCNAGYSGERCEVSSCHGYCLNEGECSLNEEDDPVCQCAGNHEGARCEADVTDTTPTYALAKKNLTVADLLSIWGKRSSRTFVTFELQP